MIESWGPFAIQATIVRAGLGAESKSRVAEALLTLHERHSLERFGFATAYRANIYKLAATTP